MKHPNLHALDRGLLHEGGIGERGRYEEECLVLTMQSAHGGEMSHETGDVLAQTQHLVFEINGELIWARTPAVYVLHISHTNTYRK